MLQRSSYNERLDRAVRSLEGLSVGDALGDHYFVDSLSATIAPDLIAARMLPQPPWYYTDDTEMALSLFATLRRYQTIDQDYLAESFARYYDAARGYGGAMHEFMHKIGTGQPWRPTAQELFARQGSFGNGAAMRVAPLGAYFADSLDLVVEQAARSAEVTHAHAEGIAGAIAIAVAAAWAWLLRETSDNPDHAEFLDLILPSIPHGAVRSGLLRARDLSGKTDLRDAISVLGNGSAISAQDTVPFVLWCAGQHLRSYEEAIWFTLRGLGDIDTNCAMVGGIVALSSRESIPSEWLSAREPLPDWPFHG
jgi:ADP-ribosylglycohydrolase